MIRTTWGFQRNPDEIIFKEPYRPYHEEIQYLRISRKVLATGVYHPMIDQYTGRLSFLGGQLRFSLRNHRFPRLGDQPLSFQYLVENALMLLANIKRVEVATLVKLLSSPNIPMDLPVLTVDWDRSCRFSVVNGELNCQVYMHSLWCDFNVETDIASWSLITCIIAQVCNLLPGEFIHSMGNVHMCSHKIKQTIDQLSRTLKPFPKLHIDKDVKEIKDFKVAHLRLDDSTA